MSASAAPVRPVATCGTLEARVVGRAIQIIDTANADALTVTQIDVPLQGHTGTVMSVSFTPDGRTLASGSGDRTIILWDVATGQSKGAPLKGHTNTVISVAFTPNGCTLASGSHDSTIILWDVATGQPKGAPLKGHTHFVSSVAFTPDGRTLASGSHDSTLMLWDVATGQPKGPPLKRHTSTVYSVAFTPDGRTIASGSADNTIILWEVATGQPKRTLVNRNNRAVMAVAFTPDGHTLASGSRDKTITLWDVATGQPKGAPLTGHTDEVNSVAFTPDGHTLASGSRDKTLMLWDVVTGQPKGAPLKEHTDEVNSVAFTPDGHTLASGSYDKTIILWDVAKGLPKAAPLKGHTDEVNSVAFTPDGRTLASGSDDKTVMLWDVATGQPKGAPLKVHTDAVTSVAFNPDGDTFASGSWDKTVILWDVASGQPKGALRQVAARVLAVAFTDDGQHLMVHHGGSLPPTRMSVDASGPPCSRCAMLRTALTASENRATASTDELQSVRRAATETVAAADAANAALREALETARRDASSAAEAHRQETEGLRLNLAAVTAALDASRNAPRSSAAFAVGRPYLLSGAPTTADSPRIAVVPSSTAPAVGLLRQFLATRGAYGHGPAPSPVAGFVVSEMELLCVDAAAFESRLKRLDALRMTGGERFNPLTGDFDAEQLRILMTLRESFEVRPAGVGPTHPNMLFAFHGTRVEALPSVVAGLVATQTTDAGFFGGGVYSTTSLEYAARYAAGRFDDPTTASPRTPRADGCMPVVLVCAAVGVAYPVTPQRDYGRRADGHSDLFGSKLRGGYDAHVAGVSEASGFEAVRRTQMQYLELVIEQEAQVLPLAILWVRPPL